MNAAKWLVAELVRIFHQVDVATATEFVEALIERDSMVRLSAIGARFVESRLPAWTV